MSKDKVRIVLGPEPRPKPQTQAEIARRLREISNMRTNNQTGDGDQYERARSLTDICAVAACGSARQAMTTVQQIPQDFEIWPVIVRHVNSAWSNVASWRNALAVERRLVNFDVLGREAVELIGRLKITDDGPGADRDANIVRAIAAVWRGLALDVDRGFQRRDKERFADAVLAILSSYDLLDDPKVAQFIGALQEANE